jgi:hypothetical protein
MPPGAYTKWLKTSVLSGCLAPVHLNSSNNNYEKKTLKTNFRLIVKEVHGMALGFWEPWISLARCRMTQKIKARIYGIAVSTSLIFLYWNLFIGKKIAKRKDSSTDVLPTFGLLQRIEIAL